MIIDGFPVIEGEENIKKLHKIFRKPKDNFDELKEYIIEEKDSPTTGDIEQWIYEKILIKMDSLENN